MKKIRYLLTVTCALLLIQNVTFCQSGEIQIRYIGNCGLHITDGTNHIYTDFPYKSGAHHYAEYDAAELDSIKNNSFFIFTHQHSDHYSRKLLKKAIKSKSGQSFGSWNIAALEKLSEKIPGFDIQVFKTKHRFSIHHHSYLITWHGKKIFLSGDTEHAETVATMKDLDWCFAPAWLLLEAHRNKIKIDTKMIGVYHIGPRDNIQISGDQVLMLKKPGEIIHIPFD